METLLLYLKLLWAFIRIGLFSIGGGYAMIPMINYELVSANSWLTTAEVSDIVAISQMTPGPFAINAATFTGMKVASLGGAIFATLGVVLPSLVIASIAARMLYGFQNTLVVRGMLRGMKPAVVGLILYATLSIADTVIFPGGLLASVAQAGSALLAYIPLVDWFALVIAAISGVALFKFKVNPMWIIAGSGVAGLLIYFIGI